MPASLKRIKEDMEKHITRTRDNKGTRLTIEITVSDIGMVGLYGTPLNRPGDMSDAEGWLAAVENVALTIHEFQKREVRRKRAEARARPAG
jgi:hypothetical protein